MIKENIYVAINRNDEIQWVQGSSKKTRYFKTDRYLKGAVEYHNRYHPDDIWKVRKCVILEDEPSCSEKPNNCDEPQTEVETMSCAECRHRPIGAEICEEACHYEPQTDWHYDEQDTTWYPSDWYISAVSYDGESVNVDLRRKSDRHKEWWLADTPLDEFFREPTAEERKAVADYIDSISVPTGVNIFDLMDEPTAEDCSTVDKDINVRSKDEPQTMYYPQVDGITPSVIVKDKSQTERSK